MWYKPLKKTAEEFDTMGGFEVLFLNATYFGGKLAGMASAMSLGTLGAYAATKLLNLEDPSITSVVVTIGVALPTAFLVWDTLEKYGGRAGIFVGGNLIGLERLVGDGAQALTDKVIRRKKD